MADVLPNGAERRKHPRYSVHFPVEIDTIDRLGRVGLSRDASANGMLLNTRSRLTEGERVMLTVQFPAGQSEQARLHGRVVRVSSVDLSSNLPWHYLAAIQFDETSATLELAIREHAQGSALS